LLWGEEHFLSPVIQTKKRPVMAFALSGTLVIFKNQNTVDEQATVVFQDGSEKYYPKCPKIFLDLFEGKDCLNKPVAVTMSCRRKDGRYPVTIKLDQHAVPIHKTGTIMVDTGVDSYEVDLDLLYQEVKTTKHGYKFSSNLVLGLLSHIKSMEQLLPR
jgi:hypothetical protein